MLEKIERALPAPAAVRELAKLGFTTVVVHHPQVGPGSNRRKILFARVAGRRGSHLRQLQTSLEMTAYAIEVGAAR